MVYRADILLLAARDRRAEDRHPLDNLETLLDGQRIRYLFHLDRNGGPPVRGSNRSSLDNRTNPIVYLAVSLVTMTVAMAASVAPALTAAAADQTAVLKAY